MRDVPAVQRRGNRSSRLLAWRATETLGTSPAGATIGVIMSRFLVLFCLFLSLRMMAALPESDLAIRQLVQQYLDARDRNDAEALRNLFVPGSDQLVSNGEWRRGREAVVSGTLETSQRTGGKRTITVESVRFLTPDAAVADGRYDLTGLEGSQNLHMWSTFVIVRTPGGWRIAAIRNMRPAKDQRGN